MYDVQNLLQSAVYAVNAVCRCIKSLMHGSAWTTRIVARAVVLSMDIQVPKVELGSCYFVLCRIII